VSKKNGWVPADYEDLIDWFDRGTPPQCDCSAETPDGTSLGRDGSQRVWGRHHFANKTWHYGFFCVSGEHKWVFTNWDGDRQDWVSDLFVEQVILLVHGHEILEQHTVEELCPIFQCNVTPESCAYADCPNLATEVHHFAPKSLFPDDYDKWPTAPLCEEHHHVIWHPRVTPYLQNYGAYKLLSPDLYNKVMDLIPEDQVEAIKFQQTTEQELKQGV